jgi:LmbE family N-acetylglucosaminyl deacetylase
MLNIEFFRRILVLGAHPDDGEFGAGATMARFAEEKKEVFYAMFSLCEDSLPADYPRDTLRREALDSSRVIGIPESNLIFMNYPLRKFPDYRQEILEDMVKLRQDLKPDLVIMPSNQDLHQDHAVIASEGWRAFKTCSIIGYESVRNNLTFTTHLFSRISSSQLEKKIQAVKSYKSQLFRSYFQESFIRALAEVRGQQIDGKLAEAFEVKRIII